VEIALQASAFLVLRRHQPLARRAQVFQALQQLRGQADVLQNEARLRRQVAQQLLFDRGEGFALTLPHRQRPQQHPLVADRHSSIASGNGGQQLADDRHGRAHLGFIAVGPLRSGSQLVTASQPYLRPLSAGSLGQDTCHARQDIIGGIRLGDVLREL
jgi:hypothetical protein